jgi:hypothetical protein
VVLVDPYASVILQRVVLPEGGGVGGGPIRSLLPIPGTADLLAVAVGFTTRLSVSGWQDRLDSQVTAAAAVDLVAGLARSSAAPAPDLPVSGPLRDALIADRLECLLGDYLGIDLSPASARRAIAAALATDSATTGRLLLCAYSHFALDPVALDAFFFALEAAMSGGTLRSPPAELVQSFVAHAASSGDADRLGRTEECLMQLDVASIDLNQVIRVCRSHRLVGALAFLSSRALGDYEGPVREAAGWLASTEVAEPHAFRSIARKLNAYLASVLDGKGYPRGTVPPDSLAALRPTLLQLLCHSTNDADALPLSLLLRGDAAGALPVLDAIVENDVCDGGELAETAVPALVDLTVDPLRLSPAGPGVDPFVAPRPGVPLADAAAVLRWTTSLLAPGRLDLTSPFGTRLAAHLLAYCAATTDPATQSSRESALLLLLPLLDPPQLIPTLTRPHLLRLAARGRLFAAVEVLHASNGDYDAMLRARLADDRPERRAGVFSLAQGLLDDAALSATQHSAVVSAVFAAIDQLLEVDEAAAARLLTVASGGAGVDGVLVALGSRGRAKLSYLSAVLAAIDEEGGEKEKGGGSASSRAVDLTQDQLTLFLELLAEFGTPAAFTAMVVEQGHRFPLDAALRIARSARNEEASLHLLERTGDAAGALDILVRRMSRAIQEAKTELEREEERGRGGGGEGEGEEDGEAERAVRRAVRDGLSFCARWSARLSPEAAVDQWFAILDAVLAPLSALKERAADKSALTRRITVALGRRRGTASGPPKPTPWLTRHSPTPPRSPSPSLSTSPTLPSAQLALGTLLTTSLQEILTAMAGRCDLAALGARIVSGAGRSLGDFRGLLSGLLSSAAYEERTARTVCSIVGRDLAGATRSLVGARVSGIASRPDPSCASCRGSLTVDDVALFNCGHSFHKVRCLRRIACQKCVGGEGGGGGGGGTVVGEGVGGAGEEGSEYLLRLDEYVRAQRQHTAALAQIAMSLLS